MGNKTELITDFVCVATSGNTIDGRHIDAQDLKDMAETYDPEKYTAVIWWEHWRWRNFGRVVEVKAEDGEEGKTRLYARIAPSLEMIELNKDGQGLFTSIEITPNFANTGKAYLSGLAFTDQPASLGTTQLNFSKRIKNDSVKVGNCEQLDFSKVTFSEDETRENLLNKFFNLGKKLFSTEEVATAENPAINPENNNKKEEKEMTEEQFNKLIGAVQGLGAKIDQHFSVPQPTEPAEKPKTEEKPAETGVTAEQFNKLMQQVEDLGNKFNQALTQEVTQVPNGAPSEEQKFNMAI
ncbi:TPA: GPO family capsid scaffolding protein [Pasteurella multocida]|uniref:GPO family capsid scaffolding protein n=1 Tax=Pasteurella multocida TaxID=747 RepID=UPI0014613CF5|nr:GPO family capsid scaffolding protein [Pasteurella multocida]NMR23211.1 GPO family capsid scaffolding protein [Pasteurella multocida]HDR1272503.1 GPO family capsid scaffolding protein [Pasteurella multocida]